MAEPDGPKRDRHGHLSDVEELLIHHVELPQTAVSQAIDRGLVLLGKAASWLWLAVVGIIIYAVVGRYAFGSGSVTLEEWQWHIAGAAWLIGLAYTFALDEHVRVDVLHERLSLKSKAWIELLGLLFLLLPFLVAAAWECIPYALAAYEQGETSQAPAGLPHRWILKGILALAFVLLIVGAFSRLLRVTAFLFGVPRPRLADGAGESAETG